MSGSGRFMTLAQIAVSLQVPLRKAYEIAAQCKPVALPGGRHLRVERSNLTEWLDGRREPAARPPLPGSPRGEGACPVLTYDKATEMLMTMGLSSEAAAYCTIEAGRTIGIIYFIEAVGCERVKVGWSQGWPEQRLASLQTACPFPLNAMVGIQGTQRVERWLHRRYASHRILGEWFHRAGVDYVITRAKFEAEGE